MKWITLNKNLEDMIELKNNFIKVLQNETARFKFCEFNFKCWKINY